MTGAVQDAARICASAKMRHAGPSLSLRQRRLSERDRSERALLSSRFPSHWPPPSLPRGSDEALFRGIRRIGDQVFFVEPTGIDIAVPLDLPRKGVADGPRTLDLAPHAGRDLELLREGLVEALGWQAGGDRLFEKAPMEQQRIAATDDGEGALFKNNNNETGKDCRAC